MFVLSARSRLNKIMALIEDSNRGVYQRIDENRALLEYLNAHAPTLLQEHPWIFTWVACQDEFLTKLADTASAEMAVRRPLYPRPWPTTVRVRRQGLTKLPPQNID